MPRNGERGFTLIELLVVLMIIALLAAIGIPVFLSQRLQAQDAAAKSTARVAAGALHLYHQDHNTFAGVDRMALEQIEPSLADAPALTVSGSIAGYALSVESASGAQGGGPFEITYGIGGATGRTCARPGHGGCPASGNW